MEDRKLETFISSVSGFFHTFNRNTQNEMFFFFFQLFLILNFVLKGKINHIENPLHPIHKLFIMVSKACGKIVN